MLFSSGGEQKTRKSRDVRACTGALATVPETLGAGRGGEARAPVLRRPFQKLLGGRRGTSGAQTGISVRGGYLIFDQF